MQFPAQAPNRAASVSAWGRGRSAAHSRSAQQVLLKGDSDARTSRMVHFPFQPLPRWFQRLAGSRMTSGFNVYHPKVQCHGIPGTLDSPSPLRMRVVRMGTNTAPPCQILQLKDSVWVQDWIEYVMGGLQRPAPPCPSNLSCAACGNGQ